MRKIKYIIAGISAAVFMVSCELDNFDGPDAQVYGAVIDAETEELIQQEIGTSGDAACVQVIEYGYAIRKVQQWKLMLNGEYRNNLDPLAELNKRIFKSANRFVVNVVYILKDCKCTYFP